MAGLSVVATRWQDIQGRNNWEGLINPLHPDLREAGIRYGELVEAMYDAIDMENDSEYVYYSLFGKSKLFSSVGIKPGYIITKYLYSTLKVNDWGKLFGFKDGSSTAWLGYIAVSNDEESKRLGRRDVAVIFRGTKAKNENWINSHLNMVAFEDLGHEPSPMVMSGFLSMYTDSDPNLLFGDLSIKQQIFGELKRLIEVEYKKEDMSITFVGHSMGAGIAPLAAADFGFNMPRPVEGRTVMVTAFVFGAPKTGDAVFKERAEKSCKVIRLFDTGDPVVIVPPVSIRPAKTYEHVGVEWRVNWSDSPYVQDLGYLSMRCHNLELYLHCLAGQRKASSRELGTQSATALIQEDPELADDADIEIPEELSPFKDAFKHDPQSLQRFVREQAAIVKASRRTMQRDASDGQPSQKRLRTNSGSGHGNSSFEMVVQRDFALMNKSDNIVVKELGIPESWWVHGFKNLRKIDGQWLPRHKWPAEDIPREDNPEFN